MLENEEKKLMEVLNVLQKEKVKYLSEHKRIREEDQSFYCNNKVR